jgi:hypothetical protein
MKKKPFQWNYEIKGLLPRKVGLKKKLWLKKDEILLETRNDTLFAYVLGDEGNNGEQKIIPYLWVSSLISSNSTELSGGSGVSLDSPKSLGVRSFLRATMSLDMPDVAVGDMEKHAPKFLRLIGKIHDKYVDVIDKNQFLSIALDYFHDAEKKFIYSDEGFISAIICLESLFNEGPSDIKYKLSLRASFLLSLQGVDALQAFDKLKESYNHRSTLVHGGGSPKHDPDRHLVSYYARKSLIVFLILLKNPQRQSIGSKKRKSELLKEIDMAMLDNEKRRQLKKEIANGLKDFTFNIPRTFEGESNGRPYRITAW